MPQAVGAILATAASLIGVGGRSHRRRLQIKANVELLNQLRDQIWFASSFHSQAVIWLESRVALDIARLSGVPTTNPKKPIPWSSIVLAGLFALGFGGWGAALNRNTYNWWSLPLFVLAGLMVISIAGQFMNREIPPSEAMSNQPHISNPSWRSLQQMVGVLNLKSDLADIPSYGPTETTTENSEVEASDLLAQVSDRYKEFATRLKHIINTATNDDSKDLPEEVRNYLVWPSSEEIATGVRILTAICDESGVSPLLSLLINASGDALNLVSGNISLPAAIYAESDAPLVAHGLVGIVSLVNDAQLPKESISVIMTEEGRKAARLLVADWPPPNNLDEKVLQGLALLRYDRPWNVDA